MLIENPIKCSGRVEFSNYLCEIHNIVNVRINKPIFGCIKVLDYWGGKIVKN